MEASEEINYIKHKGGVVLLQNGYKYHKKVQYKNGAVLWRCSVWRKHGCAGTLTLKEEQVIKSQSHISTCKQDHGGNEILVHFEQCKKEIVSLDCKPIPLLYENFVTSVKDKGMDLIGSLPEYESKKSGLYKMRNSKLKVQQTNTNDINNVVVPKVFQYFLLAEYRHQDSLILIFGLKENFNGISNVKHLFMDGTFKSTPTPFLQIYTIHGDFGSTPTHNHVKPLFYVFMTDRNTESYKILFQLLKSQVPDLNPTKISIDFEIAAIRAVRNIYPNVNIVGCWYHYQRNLWQKGRKLGLKKNKVTWRIILLCAVLPLVLEPNIEEAWNYICSQMTDSDQYQKLRKYLERYYIKNKFWTDIWKTFGERHRTNNCVEAWNSKLNKRVGRKTPNFISVLNILLKDAKLTAIRIKKKQMTKRTQKQITYDTFIQECQMELVNGMIPVPLFLEKIK